MKEAWISHPPKSALTSHKQFTSSSTHELTSNHTLVKCICRQCYKFKSVMLRLILMVPMILNPSCLIPFVWIIYNKSLTINSHPEYDCINFSYSFQTPWMRFNQSNPFFSPFSFTKSWAFWKFYLEVCLSIQSDRVGPHKQCLAFFYHLI